MELSVKCPDCGKTLRVTVTAEETPKVTLTKKTESDTSWFDIAADKSKLEIGDEVSCVLKNGEPATFVVAALNPYEENEAFFVIKECIGEDQPMNDECTNEGGWKESKMRKYLNEEIWELLPDDLKAVIKPRKLHMKDTELDTEDNLWLLSRMEVFGEESGAEVGDVHFPFFETKKDRVKTNAYGETWCYWLRSPYSLSLTNFYNVSDYGNCYSYNATSSYGVAFGFKI